MWWRLVSKAKYVLAAAWALFLLDYLGVLTHLFEADYHSSFSYPLEINMQEILWIIRQGKTPSLAPINEYGYRYKIKNEAKCSSADIVLVYLIKSAVNNRRKRDGIRKSWGFEGRFSDVEIRRLFLIGVSAHQPAMQDEIDAEYKEYGDIVQADFIDTYYNNTIKTMMGFRWIVEFCPRTQFAMFVDDDYYVSAKNLLRFLRNPNEVVPLESGLNRLSGLLHWNVRQGRRVFDGRLFAGYVFFSAPMRHKFSKWYVPLSEYSFSSYPPYVTAGAFVLSFPALFDMYHVSRYTKHFRFDDVYLGIVAKKAGLQPLHNDNFLFWGKPYSKLAYSQVIAAHGFDDSDYMVRCWEEQRSSGFA